jgi:hypothetical protein
MLAVNFHGYTRNTLDVDFVVATERFDAVRDTMVAAGFTNITTGENVVFFNAPGSSLRVDFLRVDGGTMLGLLGNAIHANVQGCGVKVAALRDLLAMKIFALSQDVPRRMGKDLPDIANLVVLNNLDFETDIRPLCDRFGTPEACDLIRSHVEVLRKS